MEVSPPYISKINSNYEKQIILLIIPNQKQESWNYLAIHSFGTKYKLKSHEKVCKNNV